MPGDSLDFIVIESNTSKLTISVAVTKCCCVGFDSLSSIFDKQLYPFPDNQMLV
jgi:hypothetical protein